jgi:hypothetical protein
METEKCYLCDSPFIPTGCGTGYAIKGDGRKICYTCAGAEDRRRLLEDGKLVGYFNGKEFTNWPGTLKIPVRGIKVSDHNFAGRKGRTDFWFKLDGKCFWGKQIGQNNEIAYVRRVKNTF